MWIKLLINIDMWIMAQQGKHPDTDFSDKINNIGKNGVLNITEKMSEKIT